MGKPVAPVVKASTLAGRLGLAMSGPDLGISEICPLTAATGSSLAFAKSAPTGPARGVVIAAAPIDGATVILSKNPRLDFARALQALRADGHLARDLGPPEVHPTAKIGQNVVLGRGVKIGAHSVILHNVVIGDEVTIGERCLIKSGAVIGEEGYAFEHDDAGRPIRLTHLGGVRIGDDVEVGSLTTVCRGTIDDTVVEDHVKIDDHVHVAHNVKIRERAMVIACAELSGSVEIGAGAWIAPNASVIQKVKVGAHAIVGLGAVVVKDVDGGLTVVGNPAKPLIKK